MVIAVSGCGVGTPERALLLLGCGDPTNAPKPEPDTAKPVVAPLPDISDPYARPPGGGTSPVLAINRGAAPLPSERPGHGEPTTAPSATITPTGYQIQFATHSPVPTPAIHNGTLLVSGGFNSRELYAYEPVTRSHDRSRACVAIPSHRRRARPREVDGADRCLCAPCAVRSSACPSAGDRHPCACRHGDGTRTLVGYGLAGTRHGIPRRNSRPPDASA